MGKPRRVPGLSSYKVAGTKTLVMSGPARSCRCAGSRMLCVASYRSAWRRRAGLTSALDAKGEYRPDPAGGLRRISH
jgi:hypothetical protein